MNNAARDGRRRRRDAAPLIQLVCNFLFVETRLMTFSSDDFVGLPIFFYFQLIRRNDLERTSHDAMNILTKFQVRPSRF